MLNLLEGFVEIKTEGLDVVERELERIRMEFERTLNQAEAVTIGEALGDGLDGTSDRIGEIKREIEELANFDSVISAELASAPGQDQLLDFIGQVSDATEATGERQQQIFAQLIDSNRGLIMGLLESVGVSDDLLEKFRGMLGSSEGLREALAANAGQLLRIAEIGGVIVVAVDGLQRLAESITAELREQVEVFEELERRSQQLANSTGLTDVGASQSISRLDAIAEAADETRESIRQTFDAFRELDDLEGLPVDQFFEQFENAVSLSVQTGRSLQEVSQLFQDAQDGLDTTELVNLNRNFNDVFVALRDNIQGADRDFLELARNGQVTFQDLRTAIDDVNNELSEGFTAEVRLAFAENELNRFLGEGGATVRELANSFSTDFAASFFDGFLNDENERLLRDYLSKIQRDGQARFFDFFTGGAFVDDRIAIDLELRTAQAEERIEEIATQLNDVPRLINLDAFLDSFLSPASNDRTVELLEEQNRLQKQATQNRQQLQQIERGRKRDESPGFGKSLFDGLQTSLNSGFGGF